MGIAANPFFLDDEDRQRFLETLGAACTKTGWQAHALCPMRNHFHLVLETPRANLVAGMQWFLGTYTARLRRETTMSWRWIAQRLAMGHWRTASNAARCAP